MNFRLCFSNLNLICQRITRNLVKLQILIHRVWVGTCSSAFLTSLLTDEDAAGPGTMLSVPTVQPLVRSIWPWCPIIANILSPLPHLRCLHQRIRKGEHPHPPVRGTLGSQKGYIHVSEAMVGTLSSAIPLLNVWGTQFGFRITSHSEVEQRISKG